MAKKVKSRSKKNAASESQKRASKVAKIKKTTGSLRKEYPKGKSREVPYDLVYVADSDIHGKGMFARKSIGANVSLGLLEGKPTTRDGIYVLWLSENDAMTVINDYKFINHSAKPNCALTGTEVVTLRRIKAHEELTHDYGW